MSDDSDVIDVNEDGSIHHLESSGISTGVNMLPFHHVWRDTGKAAKAGAMIALGTRNLEFRRAEADKMGADVVPCTGPSCQHCKSLKES